MQLRKRIKKASTYAVIGGSLGTFTGYSVLRIWCHDKWPDFFFPHKCELSKHFSCTPSTFNCTSFNLYTGFPNTCTINDWYYNNIVNPSLAYASQQEHAEINHLLPWLCAIPGIAGAALGGLIGFLIKPEPNPEPIYTEEKELIELKTDNMKYFYYRMSLFVKKDGTDKELEEPLLSEESHARPILEV